jgi:energy-coupling factor transporter ATP-binding protein EcfA2
MSIWDSYPRNYRAQEIEQILRALNAGECISVIGLSGAGKSNLLGFLAHRQDLYIPCPRLVLVDCNRMLEATPLAFFQLLYQLLPESGRQSSFQISIEEVIQAIEWRLEGLRDELPGVSLLIDRYDELENIPGHKTIYGILRALRDDNKYWLTLAPASRHPLDAQTELAELCYAHTLWLGPLSESDARWNISWYAERIGQQWQEPVYQALIDYSKGYPSLLKAVCEAYANGAPLDLQTMREHPAVVQRVEEFWADQPVSQAIVKSGLGDNPLLMRSPQESLTPHEIDSRLLTAKEYLLWEYLRGHSNQVCDKDDLIRAVWTEDKIFTEGIRDDSLAQLVRRLRVKVEPNPAEPTFIHTIPGRGYRYTPQSMK